MLPFLNQIIGNELFEDFARFSVFVENAKLGEVELNRPRSLEVDYEEILFGPINGLYTILCFLYVDLSAQITSDVIQAVRGISIQGTTNLAERDIRDLIVMSELAGFLQRFVDANRMKQ